MSVISQLLQGCLLVAGVVNFLVFVAAGVGVVWFAFTDDEEYIVWGNRIKPRRPGVRGKEC